MSQYISILGRLPVISISELEAVFGATKIMPFSDEAAIINTSLDQATYDRLGGSLKVAEILSELPSDWRGIESYLSKAIPKHAEYIDGKLTFGISIYGIKVPVRHLQESLLRFKKLLKANGKSVRVILNKDPILSTAEVYHNRLTSENAWELLVVSNGQKTYLAQTKFVQNIDSYVKRDRSRPKRDARVGMLPPKLAQTIVNLAVTQNRTPILVLDPFCGTGVVLQEAMLMGFNSYGTDLEPRMIEFTEANLKWLEASYHLNDVTYQLAQANATTHEWILPPSAKNETSSIVVACETYLGPALTKQISEVELNKMVYSVNKLHEDFLKNIGSQIESGTRLCLAVPAWRRGVHGYKRLPVLEKLEQIGYNWVKFEHVDSQKLFYDREDQFVARHLVTIIKH